MTIPTVCCIISPEVNTVYRKKVMVTAKTDITQNIVDAAFQEFLEYGYEKASMRRIAGAVGITAAALYRHFKDKEDMFSALVEPTVTEFQQTYEEMQNTAFAQLPKVGINEIWKDYGGDAKIFMQFIYAHFNVFKLIVCRSHGTRYDSFLHDVAVMEEKTTQMFIDRCKELGTNINSVSEKELHLLVTANVTAVFEAVIHDFSEAEAMHYADTIDVFFSAGWKRLFGI